MPPLGRLKQETQLKAILSYPERWASLGYRRAWVKKQTNTSPTFRIDQKPEEPFKWRKGEAGKGGGKTSSSWTWQRFLDKTQKAQAVQEINWMPGKLDACSLENSRGVRQHLPGRRKRSRITLVVKS